MTKIGFSPRQTPAFGCSKCKVGKEAISILMESHNVPLKIAQHHLNEVAPELGNEFGPHDVLVEEALSDVKSFGELVAAFIKKELKTQINNANVALQGKKLPDKLYC